MTTHLSTTLAHSTSRTLGKSSRPAPDAGAEKPVVMRPPAKKSKPDTPALEQPSVDEQTLHMYGVYADAVAGRALEEFATHVRLCLPGARPLLAKRLTDDLVAEKPTPAEAMTRVATALNNGLPLDQVIGCLTGAEPAADQVRALSLLLQDCAIRDLEAGKQVDLLSWTRCIGKSASAQAWMTHLGNFLACGFQNNPDQLQHWLSAITSLGDQVQGHPTRSDLVLALLDGFERDRYLDLNADVSPGALDEDACMKCDRLRAQLTHEAERLVAALDTAVREASASENEDIAQPAGAEQRATRIRENPQVQERCSRIVDGLARRLILNEVIDALERLAPGSETVAVLMHVLVVRAKSGDLYEFFRNVLTEAARPDELVLHMVPALLDGGDSIGLAEGLAGRLAAEAADAPEAAEAFSQLLLIHRLIEALRLRVENSPSLLPLNEGVKGMVQKAAARLVMDAWQCVKVATENLLAVFNLERTTRLTALQLEQLGGGPLEDIIKALAQSLRGPMACAYVVEALRSSIDRPACDYVVSLLVRALLERWTVVDAFMDALVNADVPPMANEAHIRLARQVALGFADWIAADIGPGFDARIGDWIGTAAVKPDASVIGFEVLQVILDDLALLIKRGGESQSSLLKRRREVEKRLMAKKAEPLTIRVIELIAETRKRVFKTKECSIVDADDRAEFLKDRNINDAANQLVRAVRSANISMGGVIEWLSGRKATFDWELLLLKFIEPLFDESAISSCYELNKFMDSLFDVDGALDFFGDVGVVFSVRNESVIDRDRMIGAIRSLSVQYKDEKLLRLQTFAIQYHEGSNSENDKHSLALSHLLDAMDAKLDGKDAPNVIEGIPPVPQPTIAVEQSISLPPTAGMPPGVFTRSLIPEIPVSGWGPPSNPRFSTHLSSRDRDDSAAAAAGSVVTNTRLQSGPTVPGRFPPWQGDFISRQIPAALRAGPSVDHEGLPLAYSAEPPQGNMDTRPIPSSAIRVDDVSLLNVGHLSANAVVNALNEGRIEDVKQMIRSSAVLNLAGLGVPRVQRTGLQTLEKIISDPSVVLQELALGRVTRGLTHVTDGLKRSMHLVALDVCSFDCLDVDTDTAYKVKAVFLKLAEAYEAQDLSLRRLVVSQATLSDKDNREALDYLKGVATGRLEVRTK